jgi:hypothetical protein
MVRNMRKNCRDENEKHPVLLRIALANVISSADKGSAAKFVVHLIKQLVPLIKGIIFRGDHVFPL